MYNLYLYLLCLVIISQSIMVVFSSSAVTSVLFLISVYLFTSILFLLVGAEFLAFILIIVYVGAVSILFLFVVMMLNLRALEIYSTFMQYIPLGIFVCFFCIAEFCYMLYVDLGFSGILNFNTVYYFKPLLVNSSNLVLIGEALFTPILIF